MSDDLKDLLDRAAEDSLRGVHLELPTVDDVARSAAPSPASGPEAASVPEAVSVHEAQPIPLDHARRRARWPLGLAAAILAILAIGGGLLAVQSADDPSPATPTSVPASDPRQRLLNAIDASVAEPFKFVPTLLAQARAEAAAGSVEGAETGTIWDGERTGSYFEDENGGLRITRVVDGMTIYYQTGPDRWWVSGDQVDALAEGPNPLVDFRESVEQSRCVVDRDGKIVVDLAQEPAHMAWRQEKSEFNDKWATPGECGSDPGIQFEITLDDAGRVATIGSAEAMVRFVYLGDRVSLELPSEVTDMPRVTDGMLVAMEPTTGYWMITEVERSEPGPTTTLMSDPGGSTGTTVVEEMPSGVGEPTTTMGSSSDPGVGGP